MIIREEVLTDGEGQEVKARTFEISGYGPDGSPITILTRGRGVQPTGVIPSAVSAIKGYCVHCESYTDRFLFPCTGCKVGTCLFCMVRKDDAFWHRTCFKRDQRKRLLQALCALPLRPFIKVEKDRE